MADLSDKARRLIKQLHSLSLVLGSRYQQESAQRVCDDLTAHIAALESTVAVMRDVRERATARLYVTEKTAIDEALRRLDGAGEGDGNG